MHPHFIPDGPSRLHQSLEHLARLEELRASIHSRYAEEMAKAGYLRRLVLLWHISREFRREQRKLEPSRESLYSGRAS